MQQMIADMNAMFPPMPDPNAMLRAAFGSGGPFNVSVMPLAGGHGVCSQSISIVAGGDGSAPIVHDVADRRCVRSDGHRQAASTSTRSGRKPRHRCRMVRRCWRSAIRRIP